MGWAVAALIWSVTMACAVHANHVFKRDGMVMVILRAAALTLFLSPLLFFASMPDDWRFYVCAVVIGLLLNTSDRLIFDTAKTYGSRLASLFITFKLWAVFVFWALLDPASISNILAESYKFWGVIACFVAVTSGMFLMRRNDASWQALAHIAPAGILFAGADVFAKTGLNLSFSLETLFLFAWLISLSQVLWSVPMFMTYNKSCYADIFAKDNWKPFLALGVIYVCMIGAALYAIAMSPNPAYANAIAVLNVVWLMLAHKLFGVKDDGRMWTSLLFVAGAVGIVLLTN